MLHYQFCNNCGKNGHIFHQCKKPIISLGIILFRKTPKNKYEYLMICRKDTLGYIDFLRGKYPINNKTYLMNLINEMTVTEKHNLLTKDFSFLWHKLWGERIGLQYKNEEKTSQDKFHLLLNGSKYIKYTLKQLIQESTTNWETPEWGFPKGRRNQNENDLNAAKREFQEETGISLNNISLVDNLLSFEEIFMGSNLKSYTHKYYLANINDNDIPIDNFQVSEVSNTKWCSFDETLKLIRNYNYEKINLIKSINKILHKYSLIS